MVFYEPWYLPWVSYPVSAPLNREGCIQSYLSYVKEVEETVPSDRLLMMHVSEGWQPLCEFLQVEVPDLPFPNINSRNELQELAQVVEQVSVLYPFLLFALVLLVSVFLLLVRTLLRMAFQVGNQTAGPKESQKRKQE